MSTQNQIETTFGPNTLLQVEDMLWVKLKNIVHYDTSAMKRFLTSDVITLVKKTFFRRSIVRNFISRGVKMRISAREACVKPHLRTLSDIKYIFFSKR